MFNRATFNRLPFNRGSAGIIINAADSCILTLTEAVTAMSADIAIADSFNCIATENIISIIVDVTTTDEILLIIAELEISVAMLAADSASITLSEDQFLLIAISGVDPPWPATDIVSLVVEDALSNHELILSSTDSLTLSGNDVVSQSEFLIPASETAIVSTDELIIGSTLSNTTADPLSLFTIEHTPEIVFDVSDNFTVSVSQNTIYNIGTRYNSGFAYQRQTGEQAVVSDIIDDVAAADSLAVSVSEITSSSVDISTFDSVAMVVADNSSGSDFASLSAGDVFAFLVEDSATDSTVALPILDSFSCGITDSINDIISGNNTSDSGTIVIDDSPATGASIQIVGLDNVTLSIAEQYLSAEIITDDIVIMAFFADAPDYNFGQTYNNNFYNISAGEVVVLAATVPIEDFSLIESTDSPVQTNSTIDVSDILTLAAVADLHGFDFTISDSSTISVTYGVSSISTDTSDLVTLFISDGFFDASTNTNTSDSLAVVAQDEWSGIVISTSDSASISWLEDASSITADISSVEQVELKFSGDIPAYNAWYLYNHGVSYTFTSGENAHLEAFFGAFDLVQIITTTGSSGLVDATSSDDMFVGLVATLQIPAVDLSSLESLLLVLVGLTDRITVNSSDFATFGLTVDGNLSSSINTQDSFLMMMGIGESDTPSVKDVNDILTIAITEDASSLLATVSETDQILFLSGQAFNYNSGATYNSGLCYQILDNEGFHVDYTFNTQETMTLLVSESVDRTTLAIDGFTVVASLTSASEIEINSADELLIKLAAEHLVLVSAVDQALFVLNEETVTQATIDSEDSLLIQSSIEILRGISCYVDVAPVVAGVTSIDPKVTVTRYIASIDPDNVVHIAGRIYFGSQQLILTSHGDMHVRQIVFGDKLVLGPSAVLQAPAIVENHKP